MPSDPGTEPILVICEAEDDCAFMEWTAGAAKVDGLVIPVGNWQVDGDLFTAILNEPVFGGTVPPIVAIFDADNNPTERRKQVIKRLRALAPSSNPTTYLLPDDHSRGELEDLFLSAVIDHELLECAAVYVDCLKSKGFSDAKYAKLKYQAYSGPIRFTKRAIKHAEFHSELDFNHRNIQKLAVFLKSCASKE